MRDVAREPHRSELRILHVIPAIADRYGGPSETVVSISKALIERGVQSTIVTTDADGPHRLPVAHGCLGEWKSVPVRFFPRVWGEALKYSPALAAWLRGHVQEFDVVHIHAVFSHASVAAGAACASKGIPYLVRPLGTLDPATVRRRRMRKKLFWRLWARRLMHHAAGIHYSTRRERELVESGFGLGRGFVVANGVEVPPLDDAVSDPNRARARDPERPAYVLVMARLDPIKRMELLIDGFADASKAPELSNWRLVLVGDGPPDYVRSLRGRVASMPVSGRIDFKGWLSGEAKAAILCGARLSALVSGHENFGRSVAESLAAGKPVVVSEDVFLADLVREYDAGWVVQGTLREVSSALRAAMKDPDACLEKGRAAHRLASEHLEIGRSTDMLIEHYRTIVRCACAPSPSHTDSESWSRLERAAQRHGMPSGDRE